MVMVKMIVEKPSQSIPAPQYHPPLLNNLTMHTKGVGDARMMTQNRMILDTQAAIDLFKHEHYITVYTEALELTTSPAEAKQLTEQVFARAAIRFARWPVPANCDMYLVAQVHLVYAQQVLPPELPQQPAAQHTPLTETKISAPSRAQAAQPVSKVQVSPKQPAVMEQAIPAPPKTPVMQAMPPMVAPVAAATAPKPASAVKSAPQTAIQAKTDVHDHGVIYNANDTVYWTPDGEARTPVTVKAAGTQPVTNPWAQPKEENKHSTLLSILNTMLVLLFLASIVFLLFELNILPMLF